RLGKMMAGGAGSFALNGQAATFLRTLRLGASAGSFALTGQAATLTYAPGASWQTVLTVPIIGNSAGWNGYTIRQWLSKTTYAASGGSKIRITLEAGSTAGFTIDDCFIGYGAASGDAYDFDATPTRLTFSGSNGATVSAGGALVSDELPFSLDPSKDLIVSAHFSSTSSVANVASSSGSHQGYYRSGVNQAGTVDVSGYTTSRSYLVSKVEILV
ncbi:MAG: hypothetical protein WA973_13195, partial [Mesorhizobium sp.]